MHQQFQPGASHSLHISSGLHLLLDLTINFQEHTKSYLKTSWFVAISLPKRLQGPLHPRESATSPRVCAPLSPPPPPLPPPLPHPTPQASTTTTVALRQFGYTGRCYQDGVISLTGCSSAAQSSSVDLSAVLELCLRSNTTKPIYFACAARTLGARLMRVCMFCPPTDWLCASAASLKRPGVTSNGLRVSCIWSRGPT